MRSRTNIFFVLILISAITFACSTKAADSVGMVVAGHFYPADKTTLQKDVDGYLKQAVKKDVDGDIIGVISPHAGYQYSGPVAGMAFKQLEVMKYKRVVVIAPSHRVALNGAVFPSQTKYRTPLGVIDIDRKSIEEITKKFPWAKIDDRPYAQEHALEVELPFLQTVLKGFILVPIIVGVQDDRVLDEIAKGLNETFPAKDTLFVASTDLSHYLKYDEAVKLDERTLGYIKDKNLDEYRAAVAKDEISLCGSSPVHILKKIVILRGGKFEMIGYKNSGDTTGDKSRVVGYGALVAVVVVKDEIGDAQKNELIKFARETLVAHVKNTALPKLPTDPVLKKELAAFVTLKKHGELRGCIGKILPDGPLDKTVQSMTMAAATEDPRFPPVRPEELTDIKLEISVLTVPTPLPNPLDVQIGKDGLILEKGFHRGVLLPQVPTEQGWNRDEYLAGICRKSGLEAGCWKDAKLKRFQAVVFGDSPLLPN